MDGEGEAEEEDFGGLMVGISNSIQCHNMGLLQILQSTLKAVKSKKGKKKPKKGSEPSVSFEDGPPPGQGSDGEAAAAGGDISASKAPIQVTADDLADEEWGPVEEKGKKGKKGKNSKIEQATPGLFSFTIIIH